MILGLLLSILVLYGLLLFWIVNERVKEVVIQLKKVREEVQGVSTKFEELKRLLTTEGGDLSADSASFSFEMFNNSEDDS
ncbi:MAG: hypothetical protein J7J32_01005 [Candidatus Atribacteria bacterium]|nr:hypothetical protein [Candidatus Atribacteria bacterium]MCD6349283.1 hypothetical protein [Candidatus Atribacteria bacterium]